LPGIWETTAEYYDMIIDIAKFDRRYNAFQSLIPRYAMGS